jgi:hypothetical protein
MKKTITKKSLVKAKSGGVYKKGSIKKMQPGGPMTQTPAPTPPVSTTPSQNTVITSPSGQQRVMTKSQTPSNFTEAVGGANQFVKRGGAIKPTYKKGGATKNAKLAALAAPKNKITRADVIAGALKNKKKK